MFEVKSKFHLTKWCADKTHWTDLFRPVIYSGFVGNPKTIPFYYAVSVGHSAMTDLTVGVDELFAAMRRDTRNGIKKAINAGCCFSVVNGVDEYAEFHNEFCRGKGIDLFTSAAKLRRYAKTVVTKVEHNGVVLAMMISIFDEDTKTAISLLSSTCRFSKGIDLRMVGNANRLLRLRTLELAKDMGYEKYDWGGICTDPNDPRYSISEYKLSFGGKVFENRTLKSPLYSFLEIVRNTARKICRH